MLLAADNDGKLILHYYSIKYHNMLDIEINYES